MPKVTLSEAASRRAEIQEFLKARARNGVVPSSVQHEAAKRWRVTVLTIRTAIKSAGLDYERKAKNSNGMSTGFRVVGLFLAGVPQSEIAEQVGLSRQRIHDILESARRHMDID